MNLYIITEYAGNGDMFQRLRRLAQKRQMMPEDKAWVFFIQLAIGIQALHRNNILHRYLPLLASPHSPPARMATCCVSRPRAAPAGSGAYPACVLLLVCAATSSLQTCSCPIRT